MPGGHEPVDRADRGDEDDGREKRRGNAPETAGVRSKPPRGLGGEERSDARQGQADDEDAEEQDDRDDAADRPRQQSALGRIGEDPREGIIERAVKAARTPGQPDDEPLEGRQALADARHDGLPALGIVDDQPEHATDQQQARQQREQCAVGETTGQQAATGVGVASEDVAGRRDRPPPHQPHGECLDHRGQPHDRPSPLVSRSRPRRGPAGDRRRGPVWAASAAPEPRRA